MKHITEFANQIEEVLNWLKTDYSIKRPKGSPLHHIYTIVCHERELCLGTGVAASGRLSPEELRAFFGLWRICDKLDRARTAGRITQALRKHIELLDKGIPSRTSQYKDFPLDASKKPEIVTASNVLFELTVALAALEIGTDIVLEPPNGKGKPDVCVSVNGECWAFACKVLNGNNELTWFDTIRKGIEKTRQQLDGQDEARGCLFVSVQNVFARNNIIYLSNDAINSTLKKRAEECSQGVQKRLDNTGEINTLFQDTQMEPGIVIYFEEVFSKGESPRSLLLPGDAGWHTPTSQILYAPVSYAQHITFGTSNQQLSPVPEAMAKALTGPNTAPI